MSFQNTYTIEAYPHGERTVVATLHGTQQNRDHDLRYAAMRAGTTEGSEVDGIVAHAQAQAKVRGEYVDVFRVTDKGGARFEQHIATVGPEGVV